MTHADRFSQWDAAYVLGALSPTDRHAFEEHLGDCPTCRTAIADLAVLPGLLAAIEPDAMPALLEAEAEAGSERQEAPSDVQPGVQHLARRVTRRRRWRATAVLGAAASALLLAPLLPIAAEAPLLTARLTPVAGSHLTAEARLTAEPWGARVAVDCHYPAGSAWARATEYALYLTDRQGHSTLLSTWDEGPGATAHVVATTATPVRDMARLDVRTTASGAVVLAKAISPAG
jgi:Putative zinc-finger